MNKGGRLSNKEIKYIEQHCEDMTLEQLTQKLVGKTEYQINKCIKKYKHLKENKFSEEALLLVLHSKTYWLGVADQFSKDEVILYEKYWVELFKQFNQDVEFSEEMQIDDLVKLQILMNRNLIERNNTRIESEKIEKDIRTFLRQNGEPPYSDPSLTMQYQNLITNSKSIQIAYISMTNEYKLLMDKKQGYLKELKATREQRIEQIRNSKADWVNLMKKLRDEKLREKEGREVELMNLAAKKEMERLSEYHTYLDSTIDVPILNAENIDRIAEEI
jgi:Skp family chaperone for outer membrane proteins